jgi:hypothetical protein
VLDRGIDVCLTVVGTGIRGRFTKRTERSLGEHVAFTGFIDDRTKLRALFARSQSSFWQPKWKGPYRRRWRRGLAKVSTKVGARGWSCFAAQGTGDCRARLYFTCSRTPLPS